MVVSDLSTLQSVLEGSTRYSDGLFRLSDRGPRADPSEQEVVQTKTQNPAERSEVGNRGSNEAFWNDFLPDISSANYAAAAATQCMRAVEGTIDVLSHITASASSVNSGPEATSVVTTSSTSLLTGPTVGLRHSAHDGFASSQDNMSG